MSSLFNLSAIVDVAIVSLFVYLLLIFIKQTRSYFIFYTLTIVVLLNVFASEYDLGLTRKIIDPIITSIIVIFIVVFQREIRRFFRWVALSRGKLEKRLAQFDEVISSSLSTVLFDMAKKRVGGIIVLSGEYPLDDVIEGGFSLDGKISAPLIMSVFDDSTPGHDGAILIENRRISKFGVHLPLAENFKGFSDMGTRHRAACGITEHTDALALVVSEERGTVSIAQEGHIQTIKDKEELEAILHTFIKTEHAPQNSWWTVFVEHNLTLKLVSVALAAAFWFLFVYQASIINKEIVVPFEFQRLPVGLLLSETSSSTAQITISGNSQDINNLKPSDIRILVNLNEAKQGTSTVTLTPEVVTKPTYVKVIRVNPANLNLVLLPAGSPPATTTEQF
jgi:diadenylate cyclase